MIQETIDKQPKPRLALVFGLVGLISLSTVGIILVHMKTLFSLSVIAHFPIMIFFTIGLLSLDVCRELYFNRRRRSHWVKPLGDAGLISGALFMLALCFFTASQLAGIPITNPLFLYGAFCAVNYLFAAIGLIVVNAVTQGSNNAITAKELSATRP